MLFGLCGSEGEGVYQPTHYDTTPDSKHIMDFLIATYAAAH